MDKFAIRLTGKISLKLDSLLKLALRILLFVSLFQISSSF